MIENDPLWRLRHALAGVALALVLAVVAAAVLGAWVGDWLAGTGAGHEAAAGRAQSDSGYTTRVTVYSLLLLYVVVGAGVLFAKVARHETRPLSAGRVGLWFASLWLWPMLLLSGQRSAASAEALDKGGGRDPSA